MEKKTAQNSAQTYSSKSIDFPQFGRVHPRSMQAVKRIVRMEATSYIKQGVLTIHQVPT